MTVRARATTLFTGGLATILLLAGCAAPEPQPSPTPSPVATSSSTPEPVVPTVAFDGECGSIFADAAFSALADQAMALAAPGWRLDDEGRLGGVDCLWIAQDRALKDSVRIEVFPITSVPGTLRVPEAVSACPETYFCVSAAEADGMWVSVKMSSQAPVKETVEQLRDAVLTKLKSRVVPVPSADREGWWSPPNCGELRAPDGWTASDPYVSPGVAQKLATVAGMTTSCDLLGSVSGEPIGTTVSFHPGGASDIDSAASVAEARDITVEGATRAVVTMDPDPIEPLDDRLFVSDGTNALVIKVPLGFSPEDFAPLASGLLAAMAD